MYLLQDKWIRIWVLHCKRSHFNYIYDTVQQFYPLYKKNECSNFKQLFFLHKLKLWLLHPSLLATGQTTLGNGHPMNRYVLTFIPRNRHWANFYVVWIYLLGFLSFHIYKYIKYILFTFKSSSSVWTIKGVSP